MSNKVPCGGFYLDDMLSVDENGKLGVNGGEPYKELVTNSNGEVKWEDRLAYEENKLVVAVADNHRLVKVSDDIPSWASINVPIKVWLSSGSNFIESSEDYTDLGNGSFSVVDFVVFITTDNVEANGIVFPKKGVYFAKQSEVYISGIASADSDTPEITWDGNISNVKKLDEKYIPPMTSIILNSSTVDSTKQFRITVDDSGTISATEVTT